MQTSPFDQLFYLLKIWIGGVLVTAKFCLSKPLFPTNKEDRENVRSNNGFNVDWFTHLLFNLLGYSVILIPAFLTVFMVKQKLCISKCK